MEHESMLTGIVGQARQPRKRIIDEDAPRPRKKSVEATPQPRKRIIDEDEPRPRKKSVEATRQPRKRINLNPEPSAHNRPVAVTFSPNGEYIFSSSRDGVRVQRVEDGKQMATMKAEQVVCLAVSNDRRWIAAGTFWGDMHVWDANTYKQVFSHNEDSSINAVDFSPDSTRLVTSKNGAAAVWDVATRKQVQTLGGGCSVFAAKYSPKGDRIATATRHSVRVYDSNGGRLLVDINVDVTPWYNAGLVWSIDNLLVVSDSKIKQFEASTGLAVAEWPVPDSDSFSCVAIPKHREFIACSTKRTVTFWDMATHTRLSVIPYPQDIHSVAFSPDDRSLVIAGDDGKIVIESPSRISVSTVSR